MRTWSPDTCECEIEEVYNGQTIVGGGVVVRKCSAHASVEDADLYDVLLNKENRVKNRVQTQLMTAFSSILGDVDAATGSVSWKRGIVFNWAWSGVAPNRVITISLVGATLNSQQRNAAQAWCDANIGAGKVVISA